MEKKRPIVYVTRDIERALGMEPSANYMVISNDTPYGREVQKQSPKFVHLISSSNILETSELLDHKDVIEFIKKHNAYVVVFVNNSRIEKVIKKNNLETLHPSAKLSAEVEGKISQIEWLDELADYMPERKIGELKDFSYTGEPFVLQYNHSHTGEGTYLIDSKEKLAEHADKFPKREARTLKFIDGETYTVNAVINPATDDADKEVLVGNISLQITGLKPFTDLPYSTIGNDWAFAETNLSSTEKLFIQNITKEIGKKLSGEGWRGLFGIDVIKEKKSGKIYLIEINARQPASAVYESDLQTKAGHEMTIFKAHILALQKTKITDDSNKHENIQVIKDGAQIVQRITKQHQKNPLKIDLAKITAHGIKAIIYENTAINSDYIRVYSPKGIMKNPKELNQDGLFIASCIKSS